MATAVQEAAKIVRRGEKMSIDLDPAMLKEMGIDETTTLRVWTDGKALMFAPTDAERSAKFQAAVADTLAKYANMLHRLAQ